MDDKIRIVGKQYLVVLDEGTKALIGMLLPSIKFLEVEGMESEESLDHLVLVTPHKEEDATQEGKVTEGDTEQHKD